MHPAMVWGTGALIGLSPLPGGFGTEGAWSAMPGPTPAPEEEREEQGDGRRGQGTQALAQIRANQPCLERPMLRGGQTHCSGAMHIKQSCSGHKGHHRAGGGSTVTRVHPTSPNLERDQNCRGYELTKLRRRTILPFLGAVGKAVPAMDKGAMVHRT